MQLSNGFIGMVSTVNTLAMKPVMVVYDAEVPKEEAILLDMDSQADLNISKAIRPAQVPREVYNYLSPRKRVSCRDTAAKRPPASHHGGDLAQLMLDSSPEMLLLVDPASLHIVKVNAPVALALDYTPEQMTRLLITDIESALKTFLLGRRAHRPAGRGQPPRKPVPARRR